MFRWLKLSGSTMYKCLGAMLLLPVKWPRLTGAIGTGLWRRHIACGGHCVTWNLYQMKCLYTKQICRETYQIKCLYIKCIGSETYQMKCLYIKWLCGETYQIICLYIKCIGNETYQIICLYIKCIGSETYQMKCLYIKWICDETYQIKCLYIKQICGETYHIKCLYIKQICDETYQIKCLSIKWTYITLDKTPNKIFKNIFLSFGHYYKYFEKIPQNSTLKTWPQVNKKGKWLFTQFNNHLT